MQLQALTRSRKILRNKLEALLGLLMWATSLCQHLRAWLAPLYRGLRSSAGTLKQVHVAQWHDFLDALDESAKVCKQPAGLWLPMHARIMEVGATKVHSKQDISPICHSHKPTWIRIFDPLRSEIHLTNTSREVLQWLHACFAHNRTRSLRQVPVLPCYAAADAMAGGEQVGIGGWICTSTCFAWFAERWTCFETEAQHALAMTAKHAMPVTQWPIQLPAASSLPKEQLSDFSATGICKKRQERKLVMPAGYLRS